MINVQLLNKIIKQSLRDHVPRIWSDISTSTQILSWYYKSWFIINFQWISTLNNTIGLSKYYTIKFKIPLLLDSVTWNLNVAVWKLTVILCSTLSICDLVLSYNNAIYCISCVLHNQQVKKIKCFCLFFIYVICYTVPESRPCL